MMTATATAQPFVDLKSNRIESIDLLRGIVMIVMALDHVRDYFHAEAFLFNPLNLEETTPVIFFTRWITHFCAPVFVFLAGTSAFLVGQKRGARYLSYFLLTRGLWLVFIEVTVVCFAWFFNILFPIITLQVIWVLGIGMIVLAALIHLPFKFLVFIGIVLVAGHNLLDTVHIGGEGIGAIAWAMLHEFAPFQVGHFLLYIGYPILPWTGIMILGYCFGTFYRSGVHKTERKQKLLLLGGLSIMAFIVVRFLNFYGDPSPWTSQESFLFTFMSFINVTKYPPSLLYALVTLGPALILLALSENVRGKIVGYIVALGRVPMFYYILHLYLIHLLAVGAALATGFQTSDMVFNTWVTDSPNLKGYGFNISVVYAVWILIVLLLIPVCLWYDKYKRANRDQWWLSYL